ncbi:hypothetical protein ABPG75_005232 [Micractinium tetrahymenae]
MRGSAARQRSAAPQPGPAPPRLLFATSDRAAMAPKRKDQQEQQAEAQGTGPSKAGRPAGGAADVRAVIARGYLLGAVHTADEVAQEAGTIRQAARQVLETEAEKKEGIVRRVEERRGVVDRGAARSGKGTKPAVGYTDSKTHKSVDE